MAKNELYYDLSFILYLVPLAIAGAYALFLWAQVGFSATLPAAVYLEVTRSPFVFLIGLASVLVGATVDAVNDDPDSKKGAVLAVSRRIQRLAILSFILALLSAWYVSGFTIQPSAVAAVILGGKYALLFPSILIAFSFLILPSVRLPRNQMGTLVAVLCLLAVPVVIREMGKISIGAAFGVSAGLMAAAVALMLLARRVGTRPSAVSTA